MLVPVLAGMAVMQLASPERMALPPGGTVARTGPVALPDAPSAVVAPPVLATRDLFAPAARPGAPDAPADPLNGAVIAGVVQKNALRLGIVQHADGTLRYVAVGGGIAGWRLAALDRTGARLTQGRSRNLIVAYGAHAALPKNSSTLPTTEGGQ